MLPYASLIFHSESLICNARVLWYIAHVISPIIFHPKYFIVKPIGWHVEVNFKVSFIGVIHPLLVPIFPLIVLMEKNKPIFSLYNISRPSIILYLLFPCNSYTWKFHVTNFVVSDSGSTISNSMISVKVTFLCNPTDNIGHTLSKNLRIFTYYNPVSCSRN